MFLILILILVMGAVVYSVSCFFYFATIIRFTNWCVIGWFFYVLSAKVLEFAE